MTEMEQEKRASLHADVMLRRALDLRVKNNVLIAEFMGMEDYQEMGEYVTPRYHTSWDWLMPVVEKIESLGIISFEKNLQEEGDYQALFTKGDDILICYYADTSIEATYQAVVEFINQCKK